MNDILTVNNIKKDFISAKEIVNAIDDISFNIKKGEIVSLIGTSGCGKSTLLNILAGIEKPSKGTYTYSKEKPTIGYMLQTDSLFPWLTIIDNASLGLTIQKKNNRDIVEKLLSIYHLNDFKNKYPSELSGGMKQRVALIRTLAIKPDILLLDEPFSALDYQTKLKIEEDIYKMIKNNKITTILVTHDIAEAISISDRVIILSKRPCKIKKEYEIKLENPSSPIKNRQDKKFLEYHKKIWKDLDDEE